MSSSMIKKVSEFHDRIVEAVTPLHGRELSQAEILNAYVAAFPDREEDLKWVQGSDHSRNHTNRGSCFCSETAKAVFERVGHGKYRVL